MTGFQDIGVRAVVQGLGQYEKDLGKIDSKTKAVGKAVAGALAGAAIGAAVGVLGGRFAKLEQTMAGVSARAGLTAEQNDRLTDSVIRLSRANLQSQEEIALTGEALISLQGVSADNQEQIESLTQKYLDYAQVTGQTAPDAVAAFDDILDAWNLTAEDGVAIMDQLIVSHQKFGTDIPAAQGALNKYASTFQTLGLDINDALGYINLFAASGVDAESSAAAFNKAIALLTENSDASNKKLAEMATNLGFTNEQFEAFKSADPATQFDILTKAIAATEDPTIRAQAAIDLFGTKAGPKLAEALAGNDLEGFQISLEESAGASELAANKIQGTLINKLKLLGNELTGRAMEITQQFAPGLILLGQLGPQATSAIGGLAGALGSIKVPDLSGFLSSLGGIVGAPVSFAANASQTITQNVVRTGAGWISNFADKIQNITQKITKVTITPTAEADVEKIGGTSAAKFTAAFTKAFESVGFGAVGTVIGNGLATIIWRASIQGFVAGALKAGPIGALVVAAAIAAALTALNWYEVFSKVQSGDFGAALIQALIGPLAGLSQLLGFDIAQALSSGVTNVGAALADAVVDSVTAFFTPENIGRRLADLVAIALITMFAPLVLIIHFRKEIASMFELLGNLIISGASALPGLLAGLGTALGQALVDVLMAEVKLPLIGHLKVWEMITGLLLPGPALVYEFFKQGLADILVNFLGTLPGLAVEGLQQTGEAIGFFFGTTLPDLLTRESFFKMGRAFIDFFGVTLPDLITVELPKIPGAVLDALADLPELVDAALDLVTETVTGWITGLGNYITDSFIPWDWIKAAAGAFVDEIEGWLAFIWGSGIISEWVTGLAAWMTANMNPWTWVKVAFDLMTTEVGKVLDGIVTTVTGLPQRIIDGLGDLTTTLSQKGTDLIGGLASGAESGITSLKTRLLGLPSEIGTMLALMVPPPIEWMFDAGGDLVEGFIRGAVKKITEIPERIVDKTKGTVHDALKLAGLTGSPSPWMHERGLDLMQGFVNGAVSGMQGVAGVIDAIGVTVSSGMQGAFGAIATTVSSGMQSVAGAVAAAVGAIETGLGRATRLVGGGISMGGIDWAMGVSGKWQAQYDSIEQLVTQFNSLPDAARKSFAETTGILSQFADAGVIVFEDFSARTADVQDALDQTGASGIEWAMGVSGRFQAQYESIDDLVNKFNALPDATRELVARTTGILSQFADAGVIVFEDFSARTQGVQDALDRVGTGTATAADALILLKAGFTDISAAVLQYNAGLISLAELQALVNGEVLTSGEITAVALAQYDLLATTLERAKDKQLDLTDVMTLTRAGFDDLAQAVLQYNAGIITADDLTQQIQTTFTEVATSAAVLGAQWTTAFADSLARQDLLEAVGSAGLRVIDQLNLVLTEGGQKNVETLAQMVTGLLEELESELPADEAAVLGESITRALEKAIREGTPEAIRAFTDLLDDANDAVEAGTTTILTSVEKFNMRLGDKIADKELQDKVGRSGADLMDALDLAIETGGEKGVETMAQEAFDIIEAMEKELEPAAADFLGTQLMSVLQVALETGGADAVAAVIATLAQIQGLIDDAPTTIPTPKAAGSTSSTTPKTPAPATSTTGPDGRQDNTPAVTGDAMYDPLLRWLTGVGTDSVRQATQYLNGIFGSLKNPWSELSSKITDWGREIADKTGRNPIHALKGGRSGFHDYLKNEGLAFARGGAFWVNQPTTFLAGESGAEHVRITPASSPAELLAQPGFASSAHARQSMMGTQIQVSPSVSMIFQTIDWNRVKQIARDTVDSAIGQAKSQFDRSDVMLTGGVG